MDGTVFIFSKDFHKGKVMRYIELNFPLNFKE